MMRVAKVGFALSVATMIFGGFGIDFLAEATAFMAVVCAIVWVITIFRGNAKANFLDGGLVFSSALLLGAFGMLLDYHDLQANGSKCNCSCWIIAYMVLAIGVAILGAIMDGKLSLARRDKPDQ
jgi:hypothetical protein